MIRPRCKWVSTHEELKFHDNEWGAPCFDDQVIFEILSLCSTQIGSRWDSVLSKREVYRKAFRDFDIDAVTKITPKIITRIESNTELIRNRLKIEAIVNNARCIQKIRQKTGSFSDFLWHFVNFEPVDNAWPSTDLIPKSTPISEKLSLSLKRLGFKYAGERVCYSLMQTIGMVNDHTLECFRYDDCSRLKHQAGRYKKTCQCGQS